MWVNGTDVQPFQKKAQFPGADLQQLFLAAWPLEVMLFQSFEKETKAIAIPVEDLQHRMPPITEYKQVAGKGIEF
jgi:hypothetical protein